LPEWKRTRTYALPLVAPNWAAVAAPAEALQTLWLGHVTFLVQANGWNVLTDPVFSKYASPMQFMGPARFTPPAAGVGDLPPVHAILISHNHYDHLDSGSVRALVAKEKEWLAAASGAAGGSSGSGGRSWQHAPYSGTTWFCPLKVKPLLLSLGVPPASVVEMDWWDRHTMVQGGAPGQAAGAAAGTAAGPTIVAVPAQHQSARTPWDRNKSLWCGYAVVAPPHALAGRAGAAVGGAGGAASSGAAQASSVTGEVRWYFSGDTGYRSLPEGAVEGSEAEAAAPVCPAFADVGARLGPFDLSLLPIGAYSPRWFMSAFHASPEDAVDMHVDLRSRRSVGMHWGTFPLTDEPIEEPPARLAAAVAKKGLAPDAFVAVQHGQLIGASGKLY
jgi:N-acyl-phosphatidylethanolamine-hydrolysing phospholipase D